MATLRELAEYTGYSITTISRVLNDDPTMSVTDSTRAAILEAAGKLHYTTKTSPKSPRSRARASAGCFAIAEMLSPVEQLADPYYLYLRNYAEQYCRDKRIRTLHLLEQGGVYRADLAGSFEGILAIGIFSEEQIRTLHRLCPKLVFLDSSPDESRFDSVVLNYRVGIEQALDSLLSLGHTRIGFLGPAAKLDQKKRPAPEVRRQYFIQYMQEKGLFDPAFLLDAPMTAPEARAVVSCRLESGEPMPTALIAANEEAAIGAVSAARAAGIRVPQDLSIISFNDTVLSTLTDPPLTSISTHVEEMSHLAVDLLSRRVSLGADALPLKVVVPPSLIQRESVCPPGC